MLQAFDELLLLKPGGRTIYFGPIGDHSQRLIDYFQGIQGVAPIKPRCVEGCGCCGGIQVDRGGALARNEYQAAAELRADVSRLLLLPYAALYPLGF